MVINLTPEELYEMVSTQRDLIVKLTENKKNHMHLD